jgi:hypothetical protein
MRTRFLTAALAALALAPLARADGLPLLDSGAPAIVRGSDGGRYVAVPSGRDTVVTHLGDNVAFASRTLDGRFTVPVVAIDGTAAGLSADRSTFVLIAPRRGFPRARTTFAVLDAGSLRLRTTVVLHGDFSFDALSPDGTRMYLVHYQSKTDPTRYEVRAYDLVRDRLLPEPIVDPTEVDEQMRGYPITRATTPDGRYAYTLYDGAGKMPFVHALDTVKGEARCIDLDMLAGREDLYQLGLDLRVGGTRLAVVSGSTQVTAFDTRTYLPTASVLTAPETGSSPFRIAVLVLLVLVAVGGVLYAVRVIARAGGPYGSRRSSPPSRPRT